MAHRVAIARRDSPLLEHAGRFSGRLRGAVDELHTGAEDVGKQRLEQRIVSAPKDERIDVGGGKWPKVFLDDDAGRGMLDPAFLDKWNEQRRGTRGDDGIGTQRANRSLVDRKSTRLNSSHSQISYAVFCLKKKKLPTTAESSVYY